MTAEAIRSASFRPSPMAWRGFSEDDVRDFLDRVAAAVEAGESERLALRAEIDRLRRFYREHGADVDQAGSQARRYRPAPLPGDLVGQVRQWLDAQVGHAEDYADTLLSAGPQRAQDVLTHAQVRTRIAAEDTVAALRATFEAQPERVVAELERVLTWLRGLADALQVQVAATGDVVAYQHHFLTGATPPPAPPVEQPGYPGY